MRQCRYLLARRPQPATKPFEWRDLKSRSILVPSDMPAPWVGFCEMLRANGLSVGSVVPVVGYNLDEAAVDFRAGTCNYLLIDLDHAATAELEVVARLADSIGPVPWSVFRADGSRLAAEPEPYRAFHRGIAKAEAWIRDASTTEPPSWLCLGCPT
jgi:ABC-type nitrate/sulfonate/bicarbonate transport system substrate-binding protein